MVHCSFAGALNVRLFLECPISSRNCFCIDLHYGTADKREFIKISQAVGMGFLIMVSKAKDYVIWVQSISFFGAMLTAVKGAIGYFIKLSESLPDEKLYLRHIVR